MTISTSGMRPSAGMGGSGRLDIERTLQPVTMAIGLTRIARGALLGFAIGAFVGAVVLVAAHVRAFDHSVPAAVLCLAVGIAAGVVWGAVRWPRAPEAARAADLYFGLDDRLTTALELRSSDTPVAQAQSRDAAQHIDGLPLRRSRGRWLSRREAAVALLAALAFAGGLVLGPGTAPHHRSVAAAAASGERARRAAAAQIAKLRSELHAGLTPGLQRTAALRKLDLALARLRSRLLRAGNTRTSLRAISTTQQQLHQLAAGLHPINAKAVAQLNGSLSHYLGSKPQSSGSKIGASARSAATTAQGLNRLAQSLAHLTPAQQAALARALARSANTTSNNTLRSLLRQAASALASGNPQAAQQALQQAARQLSQSAGAQAALSLANAAAKGLGALKNGVAGTSSTLPSGQLASNLPGSANARAAAQGAGQGNASAQATALARALAQGKGAGQGRGGGQGKGQGQALGQGKGKGQGQGLGQGKGNGRGALAGRGQGNGGRQGAAGRGTGRGQGTATTAGKGKGRSGAHGSGGTGQSRLTRAGHNVTVYIPGQQGKGPEIIRSGPNGAAQPGAIVPYQQVLGQYAQGAHQALDRSPLPPSVQDYVRRYFNTISH